MCNLCGTTIKECRVNAGIYSKYYNVKYDNRCDAEKCLTWRGDVNVESI